MKTINVIILGSPWTIEFVDVPHDVLKGNAGSAMYYERRIFVDKEQVKETQDHIIRHEIIHAFKFESGLKSCENTDTEQDVDWFASQLTKIYKVFKEVGVN